jgi:hypothetical protein
MIHTHHKSLRGLLTTALAMGLAACKPGGETSTEDNNPPLLTHQNGEHMLGVTGYNYTDQSISDFSISGVGSSPMAPWGNAGSACCVVWRDGTPLPTRVKVRWDYDLCVYTTEPDPLYGYRADVGKYFYKEKWVEIKGPVPKRPDTITAHIYQDGNVEVSITEGFEGRRAVSSTKPRRETRRCTPEDMARMEEQTQ